MVIRIIMDIPEICFLGATLPEKQQNLGFFVSFTVFLIICYLRNRSGSHNCNAGHHLPNVSSNRPMLAEECLFCNMFCVLLWHN